MNILNYTALFMLLTGCATESNNDIPIVVDSALPATQQQPQFLTFAQYVDYLIRDANAQNKMPTILQTYTGKRDPAHFSLYVEYLKYRAFEQNISPKVVNAAFKNIYFLERAIKQDRGQLEKKILLNTYLNRVLNKARYSQASANYHQYKEILTPISKKSGVPANYIIALWGLESSFGKIQGKDDVISAVASLAYEGRREDFFVKELLAALTVLEKGYITVDKMKGSWAGAMGQSQFMPSSLLKYGADGDGDGVIDIWNNTHDVFASIANYLATEGWDNRLPWGDKITLPNGFDRTQEGLDDNKTKSIAQWQKTGIKFTNQNHFNNLNQRAWVIIPDEGSNSAYLVYDNFKTIMHWNRSYFFAISVGTLADSIK